MDPGLPATQTPHPLALPRLLIHLFLLPHLRRFLLQEHHHVHEPFDGPPALPSSTRTVALSSPN
jgi:hypothetical protein